MGDEKKKKSMNSPDRSVEGDDAKSIPVDGNPAPKLSQVSHQNIPMMMSKGEDRKGRRWQVDLQRQNQRCDLFQR